LRNGEIYHALRILARGPGFRIARDAYDLPRAFDGVDVDFHRVPDRISIGEEFACDGLVDHRYFHSVGGVGGCNRAARDDRNSCGSEV
jgi:hypothetical protein